MGFHYYRRCFFINSLSFKTEWNDWHWQVENRITSVEDLKNYVDIDPENEANIQKAIDLFPMAITPYYASMMKKDYLQCPIRMQAMSQR